MNLRRRVEQLEREIGEGKRRGPALAEFAAERGLDPASRDAALAYVTAALEERRAVSEPREWPDGADALFRAVTKDPSDKGADDATGGE